MIIVFQATHGELLHPYKYCMFAIMSTNLRHCIDFLCNLLAKIILFAFGAHTLKDLFPLYETYN